MTTLVAVFPFTQPPTEPFSFNATLDGSVYVVSVPFNIWSRRYFVTITNGNGDLVLNIARIGSPRGADISITAGYFTTMLVWRDPDQQFEVLEP